MSSESITQNDLTKILNGLFPVKYPASLIKATDAGGSESNVQALLDELTSIKTGTFTAASGVTASEISVVQVGRLVMVKGYVRKSSGTFASGSNINIGVISGIDTPASNIRTVCGAGTQAYNATDSGYIVINSAGDVVIQLATARAAVTFCIVYIAI